MQFSFEILPWKLKPFPQKMLSIYKASWSDVMVISFSLLLSCFNLSTTWKKYHNNGSLQKLYYYNSNHNHQLSTTYLFGITSPRLTRARNENHLFITLYVYRLSSVKTLYELQVNKFSFYYLWLPYCQKALRKTK